MSDQLTQNLSSDPAKRRLAGIVLEPKTEILRKLLTRRTGATAAQLQKRLGWQSHTIRAAISRLRSSGVPVELDRSGSVARYRIMPEEGK